MYSKTNRNRNVVCGNAEKHLAKHHSYVAANGGLQGGLFLCEEAVRTCRSGRGRKLTAFSPLRDSKLRGCQKDGLG